MSDDSELLKQYATERSEPAFAELVRRHIGFVYGAALRQVNGDGAAAQDITQVVFTDLARKAPRLLGQRVLLGWLFTSTRYAAAKRVRSEQRRRAREQQAQAMDEIIRENAPPIDWDELRPVIDDALQALNERDREAVLMRYFGGEAYPAIASRQAASADAVRLRVERALDKLRAELARRGVTSTAAALALALANQPAVAVPSGLSASIATSAVAASSTGLVALLNFLAMNKLQIALATAVAIGGATTYVVQAETRSHVAQEVQQLQRSNERAPAVQTENLRLARDVASARQLQQEVATVQPAAPTTGSADTSPMPTLRPTATNTDDVFDVSALDQAPVPKIRVPPRYPFELRRAGVEGEATIEFIVIKTGTVTNVSVVAASRPEFGDAAAAAVKQWTFDPGQKDGTACNTRMQVPIKFTLNNK